MFRAVLLILTVSVCSAQSLKDCRLVFVQAMPEAMDRFVSAELLKWGVMKVVAAEEKADCLASFGRQATKVEVKSSGSAVIPTETTIKSEIASGTLPGSYNGFGYSKNAALEFVHRQSTVVVWADSKADTWSMAGGPMTLARKLVDQLKKDYQKTK